MSEGPTVYLPNDEVIRLRKKHVSPSLSVHYSQYKPLHIVKGDGLFLIDEAGQHYLDCINNVAIVGHSHPRLIEALTRQMTNPDLQLLGDGKLVASKELQERYTRKILSTLTDGEFDIILYARSGSEANELALGIAEAYTDHTQIIALDGAYHGHSSLTMGLSTYKLRQAKPDSHFKLSPTTVIEPMPDVFKGKYKDPTTAGLEYANDLKAHIEKEQKEGREIAAFISEPFLGTAGQVPLPNGYLSAVYQYVREAGGLCIADEVQTGFARAGSTFWMHQMHGVTPDILVIGKPMANGHPVSAVVTKSSIASKFFEKNGRNLLLEFLPDPLSLGLAETVFDIIVDEGLQENSSIMGEHILKCLKDLKAKYSCIGDVRGTGLFIGMEIVKYEAGVLQPDGDTAKLLVKKALVDHKVMLKEDGVDNNVIKIKPPICFTERNASQLIEAIDKSLQSICHL